MTENQSGVRLQKILAEAGYGSRRACESLIAKGRVTVDGKTVVLGARVDAERSLVEVDGVPVATKADRIYVLLNKPAGVISSAADPEGRPTVVELVDAPTRIYPVGRLDYETEGLIVLTNDGELTNRLTHPRYGVDKEYLAHVEGTPGTAALARLRRGVKLDDGMTAPAAVGELGPSLVRLTIHEGKNRQVRRMCEAVGHPVVRLVRTRFGPISDKNLAPGQWRHLSASEVRQLAEAAYKEPGPDQSREK